MFLSAFLLCLEESFGLHVFCKITGIAGEIAYLLVKKQCLRAVFVLNECSLDEISFTFVFVAGVFF